MITPVHKGNKMVSKMIKEHKHLLKKDCSFVSHCFQTNSPKISSSQPHKPWQQKPLALHQAEKRAWANTALLRCPLSCSQAPLVADGDPTDNRCHVWGPRMHCCLLLRAQSRSDAEDEPGADSARPVLIIMVSLTCWVLQEVTGHGRNRGEKLKLKA